MPLSIADSTYLFYNVDNLRIAPLNVVQADSMKIEKPKIEYTTSIFFDHTPNSNNLQLQKLHTNSIQWFSIYLILTLILVGFISQFFKKRFSITIKSIWQNKNYTLIQSDAKLLDNPLNMILYIIFLTNIGFLITLSQQYFLKQSSIKINSFQLFLMATIGIFILSQFKVMSAKLTSTLFKQVEFKNIFILKLRLSEYNTGIYLLPILWLLILYPNQNTLLLCVSILIIISTIRIFKTLINLSLHTHISTYQIFLYLCTVEVLPILVLIKMTYNFS